jgi:hypothetical protein
VEGLARHSSLDSVVQCIPRELHQPADVRRWVDRVRLVLGQVARQFRDVRVRDLQVRHGVRVSVMFRAV